MPKGIVAMLSFPNDVAHDISCLGIYIYPIVNNIIVYIEFQSV